VLNRSIRNDETDARVDPALSAFSLISSAIDVAAPAAPTVIQRIESVIGASNCFSKPSTST